MMSDIINVTWGIPDDLRLLGFDFEFDDVVVQEYNMFVRLWTSRKIVEYD